MTQVVLTSSPADIQMLSQAYAEKVFKAPSFIGKANGLAFVREGKLSGAVIYSGFSLSEGKVSECQGLAFGDQGRWILPGTLYYIFALPFLVWGCQRFTVAALSTNFKSIKFIEDLGFQLEGKLRQSGENGADRMIFGMLKDECPWLTNERIVRAARKYQCSENLERLLAPYRS